MGSSQMTYSLMSKVLFLSMDFLNGKKTTLPKLKSLEIIVQSPYQFWEWKAYKTTGHTYKSPKFLSKTLEYMEPPSELQNKGLWHFLIIDELIRKKNIKENFFMHKFIPQIFAFIYYHISSLIYVIKPRFSYRLKAECDNYAEQVYLDFLKQHPELSEEPFTSSFAKEYGDFRSLAALFQQIATDKRVHKLESLARVSSPKLSLT